MSADAASQPQRATRRQATDERAPNPIRNDVGRVTAAGFAIIQRVRDTLDRRPGEFARLRFRLRVWRWRRRVAPVVLGAASAVFLTSLGLAVVLEADVSFYAGFGLGAAVGVTALLDSPPQHIETWRTGAEGERRTARALTPLLDEGWVVLHDLPRRFGNIDHVLLGPPGVFLLETKNLAGEMRVVADDLHVHWVDDPNDGYVNGTIARRARGASAELSRQLGTAAGIRPWIQSVVVLWGRFNQQAVQHNRVIWTHGDTLEATLRTRTEQRLTPDDIARLTAAIRTQQTSPP